MTELASKLDEKLAQLTPGKARVLERLVRDAMALADADSQTAIEAPPGQTTDWLEMQVHSLSLPTADYERLAGPSDQPPRNLPRLRELLKEPGKFGNA